MLTPHSTFGTANASTDHRDGTQLLRHTHVVGNVHEPPCQGADAASEVESTDEVPIAPAAVNANGDGLPVQSLMGGLGTWAPKNLIVRKTPNLRLKMGAASRLARLGKR